MMLETTIDLIRHGEPLGGHKIRGTLDDPLSELGWSQMHAAIGSQRPWTKLISSPLSRCRHFAEALSRETGLELALNAEFREICFGAWEGLTTAELLAQDPTALQRYWHDPAQHAPANAEPVQEFLARVHRAWDVLLEQHRGEHVLLVCHGGVIRAILSGVLGMPQEKMWSFDVPYANVSRIVYRHLPDGSSLAQLKFHQAAF
jgi:alpha-ribazole phosphatase